jgi:hypothetical protein
VTERRRDMLALALLILAALVLGHDLTYLATYGPDYTTALLRTGHGEAWTAAVITIGLLTAVIAILAVLRLVTLSRQATQSGADARLMPRGQVADLAREFIGLWAVVLLGAAALFIVNENVERALGHLPLGGIELLVGIQGNLVPLLMVAAASAVVTAVAALYRWRRDILIARLRIARGAWARATSNRLPRPWPSLERRSATIARRRSWRAPPRSEALSSPC